MNLGQNKNKLYLKPLSTSIFKIFNKNPQRIQHLSVKKPSKKGKPRNKCGNKSKMKNVINKRIDFNNKNHNQIMYLSINITINELPQF